MKHIFILLFIIFSISFSCELQASKVGPINDTTRSVRENVDEVVSDLISIEEKHFSQRINDFFEPIVEAMALILFWDPFEALNIRDPYLYDNKGNLLKIGNR